MSCLEKLSRLIELNFRVQIHWEATKCGHNIIKELHFSWALFYGKCPRSFSQNTVTLLSFYILHSHKISTIQQWKPYYLAILFNTCWVQTLSPDKRIKFNFGRDYWIKFAGRIRIKLLPGKERPHPKVFTCTVQKKSFPCVSVNDIHSYNNYFPRVYRNILTCLFHACFCTVLLQTPVITKPFTSEILSIVSYNCPQGEN